ncbi:pirin family protein [Sphingosinicella terrae]|jgi:quercetin 2,3-dioxygenase|uniref:pirin family protein n=1 Tax=Sphingosinicella terrae TaxID=2172047 RepID=UPI000E0CFB83|nr:pirin family protein [Sphingosinicella terrae]
MRLRPVFRRHAALRDDIGDLVTRRPVPGPALRHLDPFLFLNHHGPQVYPPGNRGLPFGPHPHRGFETVTFILSGELAHRDSGGHESIIRAGGVQWMTAGRGLVHAELSPQAFKEKGGPLEILQLWVNLPARLKMTDPAYVGLEAADIPQIAVADGKAAIHLVAGAMSGVKGPVQPLTDIALMWITLQPSARLDLPAPEGKTIFLYVVDGSVRSGGSDLPEHHLAEMGDGDAVRIEADEKATILFGHGTPFDEPIVAHGPFVMNRPEEIRQAIEDYQQGRLGAL